MIGVRYGVQNVYVGDIKLGVRPGVTKKHVQSMEDYLNDTVAIDLYHKFGIYTLFKIKIKEKENEAGS
jgi:hypothetical protein